MTSSSVKYVIQRLENDKWIAMSIEYSEIHKARHDYAWMKFLSKLNADEIKIVKIIINTDQSLTEEIISPTYWQKG